MRRARWKRKNVLRKTGARRRLICLHTGVPTRDIGHLGLDPALGAGQALLNLSVVSPRPGIAKPGCKTDLTCFSFRCRCRSLSPGGESKGEGPQPLPFESLGGVGASRNAPTFLEGVTGGGVFAPKTSPPFPPVPLRRGRNSYAIMTPMVKNATVRMRKYAMSFQTYFSQRS